MSDSDHPVSHAVDVSDQQAVLEHRLSELEQEKNDLQLMLDMALEHSDTLLDTLREENQKLVLQLEHATGLTDFEEAQKNQSIEQFQLVAEALPVGLMIARLVDGHIVYGNPTICQFLGVSVEQLGQQKITDFCSDPGDSQQLIMAMVKQHTFSGQFRWAQPDGSSLDATVSLQPFIFKDEQTILTVIQPATTLS